MKILIISPTPTHPQNAGNRSRIFEMCCLLKQANFSVSFLNLKKEEGDDTAMKSFFGDAYYEFDSNSIKEKKTIPSVWSKIAHKLRKLIPTPYYKYNRNVDFYYNNRLDVFLEKNFTKDQFSHVLVEYVVFSKALEYFDAKTIKIIDTHDVLSNRYKVFLEQNVKPQWYSLFPKEEAKGLNRADKIIAIQNIEKEHFKDLTSKEIVVIGHYTKTSKVKSDTDALLFIGSNNKINIDGLNHFISKVFPKIVAQYPKIKLIVAGSIKKDIKNIIPHPNCFFYGAYQDTEEIYSQGSIVIIPILYGTGLKIKTIEALANGKAVVSYNEGIFGIENDSDKPIYLLAENDADFSQHVLNLIDNDKLKSDLENNAYAYMLSYNEEIVTKINSL